MMFAHNLFYFRQRYLQEDHFWELKSKKKEILSIKKK